MTNIDKARWQQVQPLLDRALDLDAAARVAFVDEVRRSSPDLADDLAGLLDAHARASAAGFLGERPSIVDEFTSNLRGRTIGAYALDRPIGAGGMGIVWLAHRCDGRFDASVAMKLVNQPVLDVRARSRFEREGTLLARLMHPNIARLLDAGVTSRGQPYLVLEYVDGLHIDEYADRRRLDVRARLGLFLQVADAVAHAHANLVVHRDLKPSNVLVRNDGVVKLLDFGIARLVSDETGPVKGTRSQGTAMVMTPKYAAPEQARDGTVTTGTDVYALGVLLFQLLSGRHPTAPAATTNDEYLRALGQPAESLSAVLRSLAADPDASARVAAARGTTMERLRRACRGDLDTILNVALKADPGERYLSVGAFADDIRRHLRHDPVRAQPDSFWYRTRKLVARRRRESVAAAVAVVSLLAGTSLAAWQARVAAGERDVALRQLARAQAINDLNEFLLADAGPVGKAFTAGDVLARAERIAMRQGDEPAETRVLTLTAIGGQYLAQDEDDSARRVLGAAFDVSRTVSDPSVRARAACAYAYAVAAAGDDVRGRRLIREAVAALPDDPLHAIDRATCELRAADIEREGPDPDAAIAHVTRASAILDASPLSTRLLQVRVAMDLAESYRAAGRLTPAAAAFEEAFARLAAMGRDDTETAGTLLNNWGLTRQQLGQPLEAARLLQHALAIASADGSEASVSPVLLTNLARPLIDLDRMDDALAFAERAAAIATRTGQVVAYNQGLLLRAGALRRLQQLDRAQALLDEFETRTRPVLPAAHAAFVALDLERARLALARGDLQHAGQGAARAVAAFDVSDSDRRDGLWRALLVMADVALAEGRADAAVAAAARALDVQRELGLGTLSSYHVGRAYLTLGRAQRDAGRHDDAVRAGASAVAHLEASVGSDHADTREARALGR